MEILKISESKIKIMLSPADVRSFGLDVDDVDGSDTKTRAKVFEILDEVKRLYGFDHEGNKLLVQFYPAKDGGAELFVTKLGAITKRNERAISKSEHVTMLESRKMLFFFSSLDDLINAIKTITDSECIQQSELFFSDGEGYYLELTGRGTSRLGAICELAVLLEYSVRVPIELAPYINEHCEKLTDGNAVALLSRI